MNSILRLDGISKSFDSPSGGGSLEILRDINLEIREGESLSITGRSGSGKSTLLYIASLIEKPTQGRVFYDGQDATAWDDRDSSSRTACCWRTSAHLRTSCLCC